MINSEIVLINLSKHAKNQNYTFTDLYRILYNPQMYIKAYSNIYKNEGSSTAGIDGNNADGFSETEIEEIIQSMKNESYQPKAVKRIYIPKKRWKEKKTTRNTFI